MSRKGGSTTSKHPVPDEFAFGSAKELETRFENGYAATESRFSQIRPRSNPVSGNSSFDHKNGKGQGAHGPVERNGDFGRGQTKRGE